MVSVLDSRSSSQDLSDGQGDVYSWARHFTLVVPLATQTSHRGGGRNTSSHFMLMNPG